MKLCKDCQHFQGSEAARECLAPQNETPSPDYVNGGTKVEYRYSSASTARTGFGLERDESYFCGPDAKWFEQRQPEQAAA